MPAPWLPLVYFAGAHVALASAAGVLVAQPSLPGAFHYHPRLIAVIHLITLGWITASILGALYIVGPLAFGMPLASRALDRVSCAVFWAGLTGMVAGFWYGEYRTVGLASSGVLAALVVVGSRVLRGLRAARLPVGVSLHVAFAFLNVFGAGMVALIAAIARAAGLAGWSPLAIAQAHAHVAVLGWAVMMIIGVSYRLVPMFLPAAMPAGRDLIWSALLLEIGTLGVAGTLAVNSSPLLWAFVVVAAFVGFVLQVRQMLTHRRPRTVAMRGRDWSTWQTHAAMMWLVVAVALGTSLAVGLAPAPTIWLYGVFGLIGFVAQMVVGIQGRLLPLHAWYHAMAALDGRPPTRPVAELADQRLTLPIFLSWGIAVPMLGAGLMREWHVAIAAASALLLAAACLQALHMFVLVRRAGVPAH